jgi:hypothetical protein
MPRNRFLLLLLLAVGFVFLLLPALALADVGDTTPPVQPTSALTSLQFWSLLLGGLVPLVTYVLNHYAPWASEHVKAVVLVVVAAVVGGVYNAIAAGGFAFDTAHLAIVAAAVVGALAAHNWLWKPAGINVAFGGGTNAGVPPAAGAPARHARR